MAEHLTSVGGTGCSPSQTCHCDIDHCISGFGVVCQLFVSFHSLPQNGVLRDLVPTCAIVAIGHWIPRPRNGTQSPAGPWWFLFFFFKLSCSRLGSPKSGFPGRLFFRSPASGSVAFFAENNSRKTHKIQNRKSKRFHGAIGRGQRVNSNQSRRATEKKNLRPGFPWMAEYQKSS